MEIMDIGESSGSPAYNDYQYTAAKVEKTEQDHLPATLDMFHEEDGGYSSSSDSSVNFVGECRVWQRAARRFKEIYVALGLGMSLTSSVWLGGLFC